MSKCLFDHIQSKEELSLVLCRTFLNVLFICYTLFLDSIDLYYLRVVRHAMVYSQKSENVIHRNLIYSKSRLLVTKHDKWSVIYNLSFVILIHNDYISSSYMLSVYFCIFCRGTKAWCICRRAKCLQIDAVNVSSMIYL